MKKNLHRLLFVLAFGIMALPASAEYWDSEAQANQFYNHVKGRILLQVQDVGQAFWVDPSPNDKDFDFVRRYLGRPSQAFEIMRKHGIGISNLDLQKIQVGVLEQMTESDSDGDGIGDGMEAALGTDVNNADTDGDGYSDGNEVRGGYDPKGSGSISYDSAFAEGHAGKIFLQVEASGEAWYVNPDDSKRYYLGRPAAAFEIMRSMGLGIANTLLTQVPIDCGPGGKVCFPQDVEDPNGYVGNDLFKYSGAKDIATLLTFYYQDKGHYPPGVGVELTESTYLCEEQGFHEDCSAVGDANYSVGPMDAPLYHAYGACSDEQQIFKYDQTSGGDGFTIEYCLGVGYGSLDAGLHTFTETGEN